MTIVFQASNGQYVAAELGQPNAPLVANRAVVGPWETFTMSRIDGQKIPFKDNTPISLIAANGLYVSAEGGGGREVTANRSLVGPWETFTLKLAPGSTEYKANDPVSFQASNGQYLSAENGGGRQIVANRSAVGPWEIVGTSTRVSATGYDLPGSIMSPQVEPAAGYWFRCPVLRTPLIAEVNAVLDAQVPDFPPPGSQIEKNELQLLQNLYANRENPNMLQTIYSVGSGADRVTFENRLSVFLTDPKYVNPFPAGAVLSKRPSNLPIIMYGAEQARLFESETPGLWHRHVLNVLLDEEIMGPSGRIKLRQLLSPPRQSLIWAALDMAIATALMAAWHYKWIPTNGKRIARRPRPVEVYQNLDVLYNFDIDYRGLDITQKPTPKTSPQPSPGTPRHPSYPSGHSTYAAAASQVLGCFFPKYKVAFDLLANNIGIARLWGGVHYLSDHTAGQLIGRTVGDMIINQLNTSGKIKANPDALAVVLPPTPGELQSQYNQQPECGKGRENFCAVMATGDDIQPGEVLSSGQSITSTNGRYRLTYQGDSNLVLYDGNKPLWTSNTWGNSVGVCIMESNGNLVIYNAEGRQVWSSNTMNAGSKLVVQSDGNTVIYDFNGKPVWATNTWQG